MLYAKYSRGYRQGNINVANFGLEAWQPEKVNTYEIGAKTGFHGFVSGTFNVTGFYNDFTNQQIAVGLLACSTISLPQCPFVPSSTSGVANAGKSTIKGIEIEASINLFKGFRVDGGFTHIDATLKSITPPALPLGFQSLSLQNVAVERRLAYVPKNQYTLTGTYTLPLDPSIGRVAFAMTFSHRGTTYGTSSSSVPYQTLPKQNLLNANVNWNDVGSLPLDLSLFVTNLTKNKFYVATTGQSFGFDSVIPNQPRMFGVRARVRFGS